MYLYDKLVHYAADDYYPFHMPGRKRNLQLMNNFNPYSIDITEIDGFDNLHAAEDVILDSMNRAARLYHSESTMYLVNGSTSGILTGISACTKKGDRILMARNCHKSAYHAVFINELNPVYLYPQTDGENGIQCGYSAKYIEEMLIKYEDVQLIVLVSPTYEGVVSEIREICKIAHERKIPVLVDEAHGAHFRFHEEFPTSAVDLGADLVIQSVHKTLPAFTQTALLHVNGNLVDLDKVKVYSAIYQTSSPSYVLMAGIDRCISLMEEKGEELFNQFMVWLHEFYEGTKDLKCLKVESAKGRDLSKIIISTRETYMTGPQLYDILLQDYKLQMEMAEADFVLAIATVGDTKEGLLRLQNALHEIDEGLTRCPSKNRVFYIPIEAKVELLQHEAFYRKKKSCLLTDSVGQIAGDYVYLYPPGIPILVPGEIIQEQIVEEIQEFVASGLAVKGLIDKKYVPVIYREDEICQRYL